MEILGQIIVVTWAVVGTFVAYHYPFKRPQNFKGMMIAGFAWPILLKRMRSREAGRQD